MLSTTAVFALIAWVPLVILVFALVPPRRAVLIAYVLGWLLLPQAAIPIRGALPDFGRSTAIGGGVLAAILLLDFKRFGTLKLTWLDVPILLFCTGPLLSSITNGLGAYDGLAQMLSRSIRCGIPYLVARLYLGDAEGLRLLALGIVLGGLIYVPLCLYEIRLSPVLHNEVYGFSQHSFNQTRRFGGWRPMVFLAHGLELGMLMASAALLGGWLWVTGAFRRYEGLTLIALGLMFLTAVLCKSTGAVVLMLAGGVALLSALYFKRTLPILILALVPAVYAGVRTTGAWRGQGAVEVASKVSPDRAASLRFRLNNEELLINKARGRIVFGWGGWARNRVRNAAGKGITTTDGRWILELGTNGLYGLIGLLLSYLLPVLLLLRTTPVRLWARPTFAPIVGLSCYLSLAMIDNLMNAMFTPFTILAMGGLATFWSRVLWLRRAVRSAERAAAAGPAPGTSDPRPGTVATADAAP